MKPVKKSIVYLMLAAFVCAGLLAACASQQTGSTMKTEATAVMETDDYSAGLRQAGLAQRRRHHQRQPAAAARAEVRRGDQGRRLARPPLVAADCRAAQGRAQHPADHDRRRRLRHTEHFRRRHSDADHGPPREGRSALQPDVLHLAVLADTRRADHRDATITRSASV